MTDIIDFNQIKEEKEQDKQKIVYIHHETGYFEGLYYQNNNPELVFRIKILFWGVDAQGNIVSLIPWVRDICALEDFQDPENMHFAGYYDLLNKEILDDIPDFKKEEILNYQQYYSNSEFVEDKEYAQHLTDNTGTHGVFVSPDSEELSIIPIHSWRLYKDGSLEPYMIKEEAAHLTPIVLSEIEREDELIEPIDEMPGFGHFFNYETAQKVKKSIQETGHIEISPEMLETLRKD